MIAHRGLSGLERENTCAAFVAAGVKSYYGIETDVHVTKDKKFICVHDDDLKRVAGLDMSVEGSTFAELRAVRMKDKDGVTYTYSVACLDEEGTRISGYYTDGTKIKRIGEPDVSLSNSSKGVKVSWDKVAGATKYRVYIKEDMKWVKLKDTSSTSYTYTGADHGESGPAAVSAHMGRGHRG